MADKLDKEKFRKLLLRERERLEAERKAAAADLAEDGSELSDYDNHPADSATDTYERTKNYALDENYREIVERIDEALRKIDEGSYGTCDRCNGPINPERLRAIPYATLCIECQGIIERR